MTANDLGRILKEMYEGSKTEKTAMIHLFGVKYAAEIRNNDITPKEILKIAGMPESYQVEINKGIKLAKYVEVKDKYK
ncbi:MAG: hypothetical protein VB111_04265 [Clostridiaceae bacterium]|nr:hypothetical protein [Clostridiaceae bacterium]